MSIIYCVDFFVSIFTNFPAPNFYYIFVYSISYNPKDSGAEDVGFVDIASGDEQKLMAAVATVGPVSAAIDASLDTFQHYSKGVYYDKNCSSTKLNHAVSMSYLLIGH